MEKTNNLPVFPNWFPYNDMLLDGHLRVDQWEGVKTRSWEWDYRGPVLLYNSGRTAQEAVRTYKYKNDPSKHKVIIGVGELVLVRTLREKEARQMVCNFNNMSLAEVKEILKKNYVFDKEHIKEALYYFYDFGPYIAPFDTGFFFKSLKRFKEPILFNWPPGPIKPIFTDVRKNPKLLNQLAMMGY